MGAFPTGVAHIDFLAADAHKWLLGPLGAAIFYVRKEAQAKLRPIVHGWHNVRCPGFVAQENLVYLPDARRYEAGSANLSGLAGLAAGIELLLEIGVDNIAAELLRANGRCCCRPCASKAGMCCKRKRPPPTPAPFLVLTNLVADMARREPQADGRAHSHFVCAGTGFQAAKYLRCLPHFYRNT